MLAEPYQTNQLVEFFRQSRRRLYKKGEVIIRPEDPPGGIFFIDKGFVKAYSITKYGEENLLIIRKKHEIFPLLWAFTGVHREVFYEAMSDCELYKCSKEEFLEFLDNNSDVLRVMVDMATEMYRIHAERVNNLEYRSVKERVVSFLITASHRFGVVTDDGILLDVPLKRHDIAASINSTRETISRELNSLKQKGLIDIKGNKIYLVLIEELHSILT